MKIGVLGLGSIGKRHAENLISLGHEVYGFDPVAPKINGVKNVSRDEIWDQKAVVIASPSSQHLDDLSDDEVRQALKSAVDAIERVRAVPA